MLLAQGYHPQSAATYSAVGTAGTAGPMTLTPTGITGTGTAPGLSVGFATTSGSAAQSGTSNYSALLSGSNPSYTGIPILGSTNILIGSQWGLVYDSVIVPTGTGGAGLYAGTDNTVRLQAMYDYLSLHGGGLIVLEGGVCVSNTLFNINTHPAAIVDYSNITTMGLNKNCGLILAPNSNCGLICNANISGSNCLDSNISFDNMTINCNSGAVTGTTAGTFNGWVGNVNTFANNSAIELGGTNQTEWVLGVWFGGMTNLRMTNVDVMDSPTFAFSVSHVTDAYFDHCNAIWNYQTLTTGVVIGGTNWLTAPLHSDAFHIWSTNRLRILHCSSNGEDDPLAFNTNEGIYIHNSGLSTGYGNYRYPTTNGTTGATEVNDDYYVDDFLLNECINGPRIIGYGGQLFQNISNVRLLNLSGTTYNIPNFQGVICNGITVMGSTVKRYNAANYPWGSYINQASTTGTITNSFTTANPTDVNINSNESRNAYGMHFYRQSDNYPLMDASNVTKGGQVSFVNDAIEMQNSGGSAYVYIDQFGNPSGVKFGDVNHVFTDFIGRSGTTGNGNDLQVIYSGTGAYQNFTYDWDANNGGLAMWTGTVCNGGLYMTSSTSAALRVGASGSPQIYAPAPTQSGTFGVWISGTCNLASLPSNLPGGYEYYSTTDGTTYLSYGSGHYAPMTTGTVR